MPPSPECYCHINPGIEFKTRVALVKIISQARDRVHLIALLGQAGFPPNVCSIAEDPSEHVPNHHYNVAPIPLEGIYIRRNADLEDFPEGKQFEDTVKSIKSRRGTATEVLEQLTPGDYLVYFSKPEKTRVEIHEFVVRRKSSGE